MKNYINKDILAVSFENKKIYITEGRKNKEDKIKITKQKILVAPETEYFKGKIINKEKFRISFLKALEKNKFKSKITAVTIENPEVLVREIEIEDLGNPEETRSMILFEMNKQLLIEVDDYIIKYVTVETKQIETRRFVTYSVIAMPKKIVTEFYDFLRSCKLKPVLLETNSISLSATLASTAIALEAKPVGDEIINKVLLSYNEDGVKVKIVKNCMVRLSRTIMIEKLKFESKLLKVTPETEEDEMKKERILQKIVTDVNMILRYYVNKNANNKIVDIYIYGSLAEENKKIEKYLLDNLDIPAIKFDAIKEVVSIEKNHLSFLYNVGVMLNLE